jgi:hypothetical protein
MRPSERSPSHCSRPPAACSFGRPLAGHTDPMLWGAWGQVSGRLVLATGGRDRTVRLWDRPPGSPRAVRSTFLPEPAAPGSLFCLIESPKPLPNSAANSLWENPPTSAGNISGSPRSREDHPPTIAGSHTPGRANPESPPAPLSPSGCRVRIPPCGSRRSASCHMTVRTQTDPAVVMSHESFMRWFCAAQAAIARPETFTGAEAWYSRPVATTSQAGRRFGEALDRAAGMTGIFNRELQDRNAPETSRWCASLRSTVRHLGNWPAGQSAGHRRWLARRLGCRARTRSYDPGWPMSPSRPGSHQRPRRGCSPDPRGCGRRPAVRSKRRSRASVMCATGRRARLRHDGPVRSRSSYARTTRASFLNHSSR